MRRRRLRCPEHGVLAEGVPFARDRSGHTRDFEDLVAWLATKTDKTTVSGFARISWSRETTRPRFTTKNTARVSPTPWGSQRSKSGSRTSTPPPPWSSNATTAPRIPHMGASTRRTSIKRSEPAATTSTKSIGTPVDVTVSELAVEAFFPADPATAERLHALVPPGT